MKWLNTSLLHRGPAARALALMALASMMAMAAIGAPPFSAPAGAQTRVEIAPTARFQHDLSGWSLPPSIGDFERRSITRFDEEGYNLGANYIDEASKTVATLYLFRAGIDSAAIWADRAAYAMLNGTVFGQPDIENALMGPFTPPRGAGAQSGFELFVPFSGKDFRSSGLMIFAIDGWIAKLRISSQTLDAPALQQRAHALLEQVSYPQAQSPAPPYAGIEDCAEPLKFRKSAKLLRLDMMGTILLGSTISAMAEKQAKEKAKKGTREKDARVFCREQLTREYSVYRDPQSNDAYLVALGDAGVTVSVAPYDLGALLKPSKGYLPQISNGVRDEYLTPFDRLPKVAQLVGAIGKASVIATVDLREGNEGKSTIVVPPEQ